MTGCFPGCVESVHCSSPASPATRVGDGMQIHALRRRVRVPGAPG
ncbi:hypothetical protein BN2537_15889 [Streptomyces venezuelae]|nr:hypothetical protein BN2537_15889 [Streptomyces venezuelae]